MFKYVQISFVFLLILAACKSTYQAGKPGTTNTKTTEETAVRNIEKKELDFSEGPQTIVYRTRGDYRRNVAVTLSEDKKAVISFPQTGDVYYKGLIAYPYNLKGDYLLDNKGINKNAAFIDMNYETYSKLQNTPTAEELFELIIDADPIVEMCNCGNREQFRNEISELNDMISDSTLNRCKKLK